MTIACCYCSREGAYKDIHVYGFRLAKSRPFHYVCPDCWHKDK